MLSSCLPEADVPLQSTLCHSSALDVSGPFPFLWFSSHVQHPTYLWKPFPVPQHTARLAALVQPVCYP